MNISLMLALISVLSLTVICTTICIIVINCKDRIKQIEASRDSFKALFYKSV